MNESIYLVDFCGYATYGHLPISFWADWNPLTKLITLGGEWCEIAPITSEVEPTDSEIKALEEFAWWRIND